MLAVLRHDTLRAELAGVGEDCRPVALKVLAVLYPRRWPAEQLLQLGLPLREPPRSPVRAVQLEQVEGIER